MLVDIRLVNHIPTPQHLVERAANISSNNQCPICSEWYNRAKHQDPKAREADLPKQIKNSLSVLHVKCSCVLVWELSYAA